MAVSIGPGATHSHRMPLRAYSTATARVNASMAPLLGAEIGPDVWLAPEAGWNDTPLPAGVSRTIRFTTQRTLAPSGPLPRYTYFTVRTKDGGLSAQFEHTVLMTEHGPEPMTITKNGPQRGHKF